MAKFTPIRTQREEEFLRAGRRYARMAKLGFYVEDNMQTHVAFSDRERYTSLFLDQMKTAADNLINAMVVDEVDGQLVE